MIVDVHWLRLPTPASVLELSHQFLLLGIHADDRLSLAGILLSQVRYVFELFISLGRFGAGDGLAIRPERVAH